VKFRWNSEFKETDKERFEKISKFWNAKLVLINCWQQPYFRISKPPYFEDNQLKLTPLLDEKNWEIDQKVYEEFETLVHKYMTPTLVPNKKINSWS
jgi:hypothetical protein